MRNPINTTTKRLPSLKSRYIAVAAVISVLLVGSALLASLYTKSVAKDNTEALKLRDKVTAVIGDVRNAIWRADIALNVMLISPKPGYEDIVTYNLESAAKQLQTLAADPSINIANLSAPVQKLQTELAELVKKVDMLINKRGDSNWVYPILPYIDEKLLEPNLEFETVADLALREITEIDGRSYASEHYGYFDEVRDLWRRKILNFRAVMIRYAGLNDLSTTPQELNITELDELITAKLKALDAIKTRGELGFQSEESLSRMWEAFNAWQQNWEDVKELRTSGVWRVDIDYMSTVIRPDQQTLFNTLTEIELGILEWSAKNVSTVQKAATQMSYQLWGISWLAIGFVFLVYLLINRSVLKPVERISHAISRQDELDDYRLSDGDSHEIRQLAEAFNTMRKQIHQRQMALEHQAMHDSLTGLPNRMLLQDRLEQSINIMSRNETSMALLLIDLDRFKEINDALGHQVGDRLLQLVGQRLDKILRGSDTVARLGGDEFAIVLSNAGSDQAIQVAEKIVSVINDVFHVENQNLYVGVSIGVALFPEHGDDVSTLIRHADIAMYVAKRNNFGYTIYDEAHDRDSIDKLALVGELHGELKDHKCLQVYYQPQINLLDREIIAVEALLRWEHPELGVISPEHIINIAEYSGQISMLTEWLIDTAIGQCLGDQTLYKQIILSINLSAWNLQDPELPGTIQDKLDKYGVAPEMIVLEITESAMMNDPVHARELLNQLSDMGVKIAIDDFGTGFSSLGYLKLLPVDCLKIDKSFVIDMLEDENDAIIVHSTIELAHNLGLSVVAEGVENHETLLRLRALKCDFAQGYHISRPLSQTSFMKWFENYQPKLAQ